MNFEVLTTKLFRRKLKSLAKKYHSIADKEIQRAINTYAGAGGRTHFA